jgi:hypothetical protein
MNLQPDLFGEPVTALASSADDPRTAKSTMRTLAIPCGFFNRQNEPCRRLGTRSVVIDGSPLVCRGVSIVHCELDCFRTVPIPSITYEHDGFHGRRA